MTQDIQNGPVEKEKNWAQQPITWARTRDWFIRKRLSLAISFAVATIVWGVAVELGHPFTHTPLPIGAQAVYYHQGQDYTVIQQGEVLTLTRISGIDTQCLLFFLSMVMAFLITEGVLIFFNTSDKQHIKKHHWHINNQSWYTNIYQNLGILISLVSGVIALGFYLYYVLIPTFGIVAFHK